VANEGNRDIVLAPGEYAYVQDTTKGLVGTLTGPSKISMSNTDQPVVWDKIRFKRVDADKAIQLNAIAPEGFYIALFNPAAGDKHPAVGTSSNTADLQVGHRINIHGPVNFALFPGQMADVIRGHHIRSNQYLLAQVYNDAAATANWNNAVLKPQGGAGETPQATVLPRTFTNGQLLIIKGTEVAFFMPPTGIKVVQDDADNYVRDAVTLERLEYCILLDQNGSKRFVKGPDVVFPEPTETFITKDGSNKFKAIELNSTSGLYVKVIADYTEEGADGPINRKAGDELFITGREQAIYFQREEHSIIRYGEQTKHYAVAIPSGEGRYVLNRLTGVVSLEKGPRMLLCDPREEVITRRILSENSVKLWYPNNPKVLEVNKAFAAEAEEVAKMRTHDANKALLRTASLSASNVAAALDNTSMAYTASTQVAGQTFQRSGSYTPPRTITLDQKYDGAVAISVWTGYAVQVISKTGNRRVVVGPEHVLLEYDETLATLELSTSKPKVDSTLFHTVYLRVTNNKVSDQITVETQDLVPVTLDLSYRVNFDGPDPGKWFEVENYVKLLTDHLRSRLRNLAKRTGVEALNADTVNLIRDEILGKPDEQGNRAGLSFKENNMRVYDVEVLGVAIKQPEIAGLLLKAQRDKLTLAVNAASKEEALELQRRVGIVELAEAQIKADKAEAMSILSQRELDAQSATALRRIANELAALEGNRDLVDARMDEDRVRAEAAVAYAKAEIELAISKMEAETKQILARAGAVTPAMSEALTVMADTALVERITTALAPIAAMQGVSAADVLSTLFKGTPLQGALEGLAARSAVPLLTGSAKG
jgi:major vault protein